jgi:hypothetical protein
MQGGRRQGIRTHVLPDARSHAGRISKSKSRSTSCIRSDQEGVGEPGSFSACGLTNTNCILGHLTAQVSASRCAMSSEAETPGASRIGSSPWDSVTSVSLSCVDSGSARAAGGLAAPRSSALSNASCVWPRPSYRWPECPPGAGAWGRDSDWIKMRVWRVPIRSNSSTRSSAQPGGMGYPSGGARNRRYGVQKSGGLPHSPARWLNPRTASAGQLEWMQRCPDNTGADFQRA